MAYATELFTGFLVLVGVGLMIWHYANYQEDGAASATSASDRDFARRQYSRRMQTSAMIIVLGVAILIGRLVELQPWGIFYWIAVLLIVFWMGVLALADIIASQYHYGRKRDEERLNLIKMKADLAREAGGKKSASAE